MPLPGFSNILKKGVTKMALVCGEKLSGLLVKLMVGLGVPYEDAVVAADVHVLSDLRGHESHGASRFLMFADRIGKGLINPKPEVKAVSDTGSAVVLDADNGLGPVTAPKSMKLCIERAKEYGVAVVVSRHANNYGMSGYYPLMAVKEDLVGVTTTYSTPLVAPFGGKEKLFGTNPIAIGVPAGEQYPIVLDMATTGVAGGKLTVAAQKGEKNPFGWAVDKDGKPTDDPRITAKGGSLLPMAGPKGYGLMVMADIFAGILSGASVGYDIGSLVLGKDPEKIGHFMLAMDVSRFRPLDEFKKAVDDYFLMVKNSTPADGVKEIFLPGEIEMRNFAERKEKGIPINTTVASTLFGIAQKLGVAGEAKTFEELVS